MAVFLLKCNLHVDSLMATDEQMHIWTSIVCRHPPPHTHKLWPCTHTHTHSWQVSTGAIMNGGQPYLSPPVKPMMNGGQPYLPPPVKLEDQDVIGSPSSSEAHSPYNGAAYQQQFIAGDGLTGTILHTPHILLYMYIICMYLCVILQYVYCLGPFSRDTNFANFIELFGEI